MVDEENLSHLTVIKRSGKKVEWNGAKIAIAIKKAFDALEKQEGEDLYTEKDVNKVFNSVVKQIEKELTLKKYTSFLGIANGQYQGFARIYVLASEIVAFTDNRIERKDLESYLASYQTKKTLSMEEIWNIGIFLEIAIIENIREVCEKIYISQIEKYKAENIVERLVENKTKQEQVFKRNSFKKRC